MMYSGARLHVLGRAFLCHAMFFLGIRDIQSFYVSFVFHGIQDLVAMADEYWEHNILGQYAKKKFRNDIWEAAYRRHMAGTLTTTMYDVSEVPYDPAEAEKSDSKETWWMLEDDEEEWENKMRKTVLSVTTTSADESAHLWKEEKKFEGAPALDSEGDSHEVAEQHASRWVEESMSRSMLESITWATYCPRDRKGDLTAIFKMGMKYVDVFSDDVMIPWNVDEIPTHMRPWLAELDLTFKALMAKNWIPQQLRAPHDKHIRKYAVGAQGDTDPGNETFDIVVNMMRLWQAVDENHWEQVVKVAGKEYGNSGNKSSEGPVNLRGNMIEALMKWLQETSATPARLRPHQKWSCEYWYTWGM